MTCIYTTRNHTVFGHKVKLVQEVEYDGSWCISTDIYVDGVRVSMYYPNLLSFDEEYAWNEVSCECDIDRSHFNGELMPMVRLIVKRYLERQEALS